MHPPLQLSSDASRIPVLIFHGGRHCCAIAVSSVESVVDIVAVEPVPGAPQAVLGVINFHGHVVPVVDLRRRFGEEGADLACSQKLVIVATPKRRIALLADDVAHVEWIDASRLSDVEDFVPGASCIKGSLADAQGLILVYDAERLLTQSEEKALDASLRGRSE